MSWRSHLVGADVVMCCGPGGVGKTTTAAAIALDLARSGRRVVVVTIDPAKRLGDALGLVGGLGPEPERVMLGEEWAASDEAADADERGELWAMTLDVEASFRALVERYATDADQAQRVVANPFFRNMATSLGGTQEYLAAETLYALHHDERFDIVVVDTPPSRNALDVLEAPGVLTRFLDHRVFRLMMLPTQRGLRLVGLATQPLLRAIGKVVGGDVLVDAVAFFQSFSGMEGGFRDRAVAVSELLRGPSTRYVVVTAPRPDAVAEATWFVDQLREQGMTSIAGVVNRIQPAFAVDSTDGATAGGDRADGDGVLWRNWEQLAAIRESELGEIAAFSAAVEPLCEVPLLPGDVHDAEGLAQVARSLR